MKKKLLEHYSSAKYFKSIYAYIHIVMSKRLFVSRAEPDCFVQIIRLFLPRPGEIIVFLQDDKIPFKHIWYGCN